MSPGYFLIFFCTFLLGTEGQRRRPTRMTRREACQILCPRPGPEVIIEPPGPRPRPTWRGRGGRPDEPIIEPWPRPPRGPGEPIIEPWGRPEPIIEPWGRPDEIIPEPWGRPDEIIPEPWGRPDEIIPEPWGPDDNDDSALIGGDPRRRRRPGGRGRGSSPRNPFNRWGAAASPRGRRSRQY